MKKLLLCFWVVSVLAGPLSAIAMATSPWVDPTASPYNAKCDGFTDDTNAFNSAIAAVNTNGGGTVLIPTGQVCVIAGQLVLKEMKAVTLASLQGPTNSISKTELLFTGTTSPLVDARSSTDIKIEGVSLVSNNTSLAAGSRFVDFEHAPSGGDSNGILIRNTSVVGPNYTSLSCLICFDNTDTATIDHVRFDAAVNAVRLANTCTAEIDNSYFANALGGVPSAWIAGYGWAVGCSVHIGNNNFEEFNFGASNSSIDCTNQCPLALVIEGNTFDDPPAGYSGTIIKGISNDVILIGNRFGGGSSGLTTAISVLSGATGITIIGNGCANLGTCVAWAGTANNVLVAGNTVGAVTRFQSGAPTSGFDLDGASNATTMYGTTSFNGSTLVNGTLTDNFPAYFNSDVYVGGNLYKPAGSFRIDHPLDPAHKYLSHSFVESPDMMNIYNGIVALDSHGRAEIKLPDYFEALNQDFRYQLTTIGAFAPVYVARKITGNSFHVAGGRPGMEVSWQVTGIRHDAYANAHRIVVEQDKSQNRTEYPAKQ